MNENTSKKFRVLSPPKCPREEADDYSTVIATFGANWRVIECRDHIQWILQRRVGHRHGQPRWDSRSYLVTREALKLAVRRSVGPIDDIALQVLDGLPHKLEGQHRGAVLLGSRP